MMWFFAVLIVLAMGGVAMLAAGKGAPLSEDFGDRPDSLVPAAGELSGPDLRKVRFSLAFRGYRMSEVDALLDRLARELEAGDSAKETAKNTPKDAPKDAPKEQSEDTADEAPARRRGLLRWRRSRRTTPPTPTEADADSGDTGD